MRTLGFLHERAEGYDDRYQFRPIDVCQASGIDQHQFQRDTSFLAAHGLAGVQVIVSRTFGSPPGGNQSIAGVWLTGSGENLMRQLEADLEDELVKAPDYKPNVGTKLTLAAATFMYETAKSVVVARVSALL